MVLTGAPLLKPDNYIKFDFDGVPVHIHSKMYMG